jgi:Domain of unknown function (DUF1735)
MKRHKYYKFQLFGISLLSVLLLGSCVKSRVGRTDFSNLQPIVLIPEGGLGGFSSEALLFPGTDSTDTALFHVNYAATNVAPTDETITIGIDQAALSAYNSANTAQYQLFPDSIFSFNTTTITVKKGDNYSNAISLAVFPIKVDPSQNYMLPISIKTVPAGSTISTNFGTIYYHFIGNPLAGSYNDVGTRYNYVGSVVWTGPPAAIPASYVSTTNLNGVKIAAPVNSQTVQIAFANLGGNGPQYVYIVTGSADFSSISVDYGFDAIYSGITPYVVTYTPPAPGQKAAFHIITHYNNALAGAGSDRIVDESFVHQ